MDRRRLIFESYMNCVGALIMEGNIHYQLAKFYREECPNMTTQRKFHEKAWANHARMVEILEHFVDTGGILEKGGEEEED